MLKSRKQFFAILSALFILMAGFGTGIVAAEDSDGNSTAPYEVVYEETPEETPEEAPVEVVYGETPEETPEETPIEITTEEDLVLYSSGSEDSGIGGYPGGSPDGIPETKIENTTETTTINENTTINSDDDTTINDNSTYNYTDIDTKTVNIDNSRNTQISFTDNSVVNNINFVSTSSGKTKVIVKEVYEKPPVENVYKTFNIFIDNADVTSNMENAAVDFKVEKCWLIENNLDSSTIILNMYENGKWIEVPVTITGEDSQYVYFKAEVSEYSTFAISSKTVTVDTVIRQSDSTNNDLENMDGSTKNVIVKLLELVIELIEGK